jgi:hypothetical protein
MHHLLQHQGVGPWAIRVPRDDHHKQHHDAVHLSNTHPAACRPSPPVEKGLQRDCKTRRGELRGCTSCCNTKGVGRGACRMETTTTPQQNHTHTVRHQEACSY